MKKGRIVLLEWQNSKRIENYSLGLFYIYEALMEEDFDVKLLILDEKSVEKITEKVLEFEPFFVGIKYYGEHAKYNLKIAEAIKKANPNIKVVMGGHTASLFTNLVLEQSEHVDGITRNESELTYVELCNKIIENLDLKECTGISYRHKGRIFKNPDREQIMELQSLNMPRYSLFKNNIKSKVFYYAMSTARGCIGNCVFCTSNNMHKKKGMKRWRGITAKDIFNNVKSLLELYPDKLIMINFLDSAFEDPYPFTKDRMTELCDLLIERNGNVAYSIYSRAESWSDKDEERIKVLRKSGLNKINIGFDETIDIKKDMRFIEKVVTDENIKLVNLFERNGIITTCYSLLFHPFVTLEDLFLYTEFLNNINKGEHLDVWTHKLILYPDSDIFSYVANAGLIKGFDSDAYTFIYAYEDGRVTVISQLMDKVSELDTYIRIRNAMIKIDKILEFHNAVTLHQSNMCFELKELEEFCRDMTLLYKKLGNQQVELFKEVLQIVKQGQSLNEEVYLERWNQLLSCYTSQFEKMTISILVKMTRKKWLIF